MLVLSLRKATFLGIFILFASGISVSLLRPNYLGSTRFTARSLLSPQAAPWVGIASMLAANQTKAQLPVLSQRIKRTLLPSQMKDLQQQAVSRREQMHIKAAAIAQQQAQDKQRAMANITGPITAGMIVRAPVPPGVVGSDLAEVMKALDYACPPLPNQTLETPNGPLKSLRIVAAGFARSGSTWQFNAIVAILKLAGIVPATYHGQLTKYGMLGLTLGCPFSVIKAHQFHPYFLEMADYVFISHRDPRDSFASLSGLASASYFSHYWHEYRRWAPYACVDMKYEDFYLNQLAEVQRMIDMLPVPKTISAQAVLDAVEQQRVAAKTVVKGKSMWNEVSGYYVRHVTDPAPGRWQHLINTTTGMQKYAGVLAAVENMTKDWMAERGYRLFFTYNNSFPSVPAEALPWLASTHEPGPTSPSAQSCPLNSAAKQSGRAMPSATDFYALVAKKQKEEALARVAARAAQLKYLQERGKTYVSAAL